MLTVHHLGISQSDRIVWLCEELEIPYELVHYERDSVTRLAPPEYKALHPMGTAPVITDGDLVLGESGAIIDYIIGRYGNGRLQVGADSPNFGEYLYWFHFANASMMASTMMTLAAKMAGDGANAQRAKALSSRSDKAFEMINARLGQVDYFAGSEFSAADIIMLFPLTTMRLFIPRDISDLPHLQAYLQRIAARPAFHRAMKKADPDLVMPMS